MHSHKSTPPKMIYNIEQKEINKHVFNTLCGGLWDYGNIDIRHHVKS